MTLRKRHGRAAAFGVGAVVEVMPPDEQADPLPRPLAVADVPLVFRRDGKIGDVATAKELGRRGGHAKAQRSRLVAGLGLAELAGDAAFRPYQVAGDEWVDRHLQELANVAGGRVGPGPASIVQSAGIQLAASRFLADQAARSGDGATFARASSLSNDSRQNLLAAYELAIREGKARAAAASPADLERAMREAAKPRDRSTP